MHATKKHLAMVTMALVLFTPAARALTIERFTLENGARVLLVQRHQTKVVDVDIAFDAGSRRDRNDAISVADFSNNLMDTAAADLSEEELRAQKSDLAISVNSYPGVEWAGVRVRSLSDAKPLAEAARLTRLILTQPRYRDDILAREKNLAIQQLRQNETDPGFLAMRAQNELDYPSHPYGFGARQNEASIRALNRDALLAFHRQHYAANQAIVSMVGDITPPAARALAQSMLQGLPEKAQESPLPPVVIHSQQWRWLPHPAKQAHVVLSLPVITRDDPDYFALVVGNYTLGAGGFDSRLMDTLRSKKGLTYGAGSSLSPMQQKGEFTVNVATRRENANEALAAARDVVRNFIETGPTEAELAQAKANIIGGFPLRFDTNGKLLAYLSLIGFYRLPDDYLDRYPKEVAALTRQDIQAAWKRRIDPNQLNIVVVGGDKTANPYPQQAAAPLHSEK